MRVNNSQLDSSKLLGDTMTKKVEKEYECPICWGMHTLCVHNAYDEDHCPLCKEDCEGCPYSIVCNYCKGEGMVTFAKMNAHAKKMAAIVWGNGK